MRDTPYRKYIYVKEWYDFEGIQKLVWEHLQNKYFPIRSEDLEDKDSHEYKFFDALSYIITCYFFNTIDDTEDSECLGEEGLKGHIDYSCEQVIRCNDQDICMLD